MIHLFSHVTFIAMFDSAEGMALKRRATVLMLVFFLGYRQVTCTHNKHRTVHAL